MPGQPTEAPPPIPDYEMIRVIGRGNYGEVWLARSLTGQYRAVKVVWRDRFPDSAPFDREFRGLKQFARVSLEARRQLALLHVGSQEALGFFYYVMELADDADDGRDVHPDRYVACTLRQIREKRKRLPAGEVIRIGVEITEALDELHRRDLVHRDIKPSNIILVGGVPKLADIGLVAAVQDARTEIGTPGFMPPEGPGSPSADVFAVGKVLYELATGLDRHEYPRLPEGLSAFADRNQLLELNAVLLRASDRDARRRYANAGQLLEELKLLDAGRSVQRLRRAERRSRRTMKALLVAMPVAVIAAAVAWRESHLRAERDLALYRASLDQAVINVERGRLGPATRALDAAANLPVRGLEFELVRRQTEGHAGISLPFQTMTVDGLQFSADGRRLGVLGEHGIQQIFAVPEARLVSTLSNIILLAGFLGPTGNLVVGTYDPPNGAPSAAARPVRIWDADTSRLLEPTFDREDARNLPIRVLRDLETVAFLNRGRPGDIAFWQPIHHPTEVRWMPWGTPHPDSVPWLRALDAAGHRWIHVTESGRLDTFRSHLYWTDLGNARRGGWTDSNTVSALAIADDGSHAALAVQQTGELRAGPWNEHGWDPAIRASQGETRALAYSSNGRRLASGGEDQVVRIHDPQTLAVTEELTGMQGTIQALSWAPDDQSIAAGDDTGTVRVWPLGNADPTDHVWSGFPASGAPLQVVCSPDGAWVALPETAQTVAVRDIHHPGSRHASVPGFSPLAFAADSKSLWTLDAQGTVAEIEHATARVLRAFDPFPTHASSSAAGAASPDARSAVIYRNTQVAVVDLTMGRTLAHSDIHQDQIFDVAVAPDAPHAITVAFAGAVLWDLRDGRARPVTGLPEIQLYSATFIRRGTRALLGAEEGLLIEVDVTQAKVLGRRPSPLRDNFQLATAPDQSRIVTAGANGRIAILRAEDLAPLVTLGHFGLQRRPGEHTLRRMAWVPGQNHLLGLTEDGLLARW